MPICAVSQAAYCFTFAELSLIVVRLPLCAVSQGSSICLSARYRRLHMLHVCQTIFTHCFTPALRGIAEFKLMPICAVSQAAYASRLPNHLYSLFYSRSARYRRVQAYAYLRGIAGCICFAFAELSLLIVRLPLCAVSQGSSLCLSARYRRLHMLHVCRIIFNRCSTPALRGIAGSSLCLSARYRRLHIASRLPNYL